MTHTPIERIPLRAGRLTLVYEQGTIRYLRLGQQEILRQVYAAVRDQHWDTIVPTLHDEQMTIGDDHFRITFTAKHQAGEVDFTWRGEIVGTADSTISFSFDGEAHRTFKRNRVGFCVLHPLTLAGNACEIEHANGDRTQGRFPKNISPHQPFFEIRAVTHPVIDGVRAAVRMDGDIFEMEDQRNWTDASFKTYCTPQRLPMPVTVEAGTRIQQTVTVTLIEDAPLAVEAFTSNDALPDTLTFDLENTAYQPLPLLGLGCASHGMALSASQIERLKRLNLAHLRFDWRHAADADFERLKQADAEAVAVGCGLMIALHLNSEQYALELAALVPVMASLRARIVCVWVFQDGASVASKTIRDAATDAFRGLNLPLGSGTNSNFTDLNRNRSAVAGAAWVAYSVTPQIHAFDDATLTETLATQGETIRTARLFVDHAKIAVSPITLKPRQDSVMCAPDARQRHLFGASWTLGSIKALAAADSVTYFETTGDCGVMADDPDAGEDALFPMYDVFVGVGAFAGGALLAAQPSDALRFDGFLLKKADQLALFVANYTPKPISIAVTGLPDGFTPAADDAASLVRNDAGEWVITLAADAFVQL